MYLIHFYSKNNIKMFSQKLSFKSFKTTSDIHYPSQHSEINCVDISKDCPTHVEDRFKKKKIIIIIYIVKKFGEVF